MSRILVTGGTGLLGCALVPHLRAAGATVITHALTSPADCKGDLVDFSYAADLVASVTPDVVVNLVALTSVDECERAPNAAYRANTRPVESLARAIANSRDRIPHLIQISTDQVYDGPGPHREEHVKLCNYYAYSKYAGELAAQIVPATILRTNFVGRSASPRKRSLSDWLVDAMEHARPITLFDDVQFSPLSLSTLVRMIELATRLRIVGTFNLGARGGMSKAAFTYALAMELNLATGAMQRGSSSSSALAAYRPKDMRMDCTYFEQKFGLVLPNLTDEISRLAKEYAT